MKLKRLITLACSALCVAGTCLAIAACAPEVEEATTATVRFDVNTVFETNVLKDKTVTIGKRVSKPKAYITQDNPTNLQVYGWYTDAACTEQWDFKNDRVNEDMTLYAKWVELYNVNYYVNGELVQEGTAFNGDTIEEDVSLVEGYKYLGSYVDEAMTEKFDYSKPIEESCNVYMQRSPGIFLSDNEDIGGTKGSLTNALAAYVGSYAYREDGSAVDQEGWVEEYTIKYEGANGEVTEEDCTYVNFGYTPTVGDGFVEISQSFDISQSQKIRMTYKNLGNATGVCVYFTTMLDLESSLYSATGPNYTQDFCYPNHTENPGARIDFTAEQKNMADTDEWQTVDFDLYEIYKKGYSIWGTSPYLGALRIQINYKSTHEDDWSNEFLIKSIEGIPVDIEVTDSDGVNDLLDKAAKLTNDQIQAASSAQTANPNGFVFPKDNAAAGEVYGDAKLQTTTNGIYFYANNEVAGRAEGNPSNGFIITAPEGKNIDLSEWTTLTLKLRNYGYAEKLTVYVYNDKKVPVKAELTIGAKMLESKTYSINLYGEFGMSGNLAKIEIIYDSVGVDNLLLIESVGMSEFMPYDTLGINFNDKNKYGFTGENVAIAFDSGMEGIVFDVAQSGAVVESAEKTYNATNDGYANVTLHYFLYKSSNITAVTVSYKTNGAFGSEYRYELDVENKGKASSITLPLNLNERGDVKSVRIRFEGTGMIALKQLEYGMNETSLPYYKDYSPIYNMMYDWYSGADYTYDKTVRASLFTKHATANMIGFSMYIGYSAEWQHVEIPHKTYSVPVTSTMKVKLVYQNRTDVPLINFSLGFAKTNTGSGEFDGGTDYPVFENNNVFIKSEMGDYEWATLTLEVPAEYIGAYLSKVHVRFEGKELMIRGFSIEP